MSRRNTVTRSRREQQKNGFFDEMFANANYEPKNEELIKLNKAKIPKLCLTDVKQFNKSLKETRVSINEIGMQLVHHENDPRSLCQGALLTLELERRDRIPKAVLRQAKKLRAELNPDLTFSDNSQQTTSFSTAVTQGGLDATKTTKWLSAKQREEPQSIAGKHSNARELSTAVKQSSAVKPLSAIKPSTAVKHSNAGNKHRGRNSEMRTMSGRIVKTPKKFNL